MATYVNVLSTRQHDCPFAVCDSPVVVSSLPRKVHHYLGLYRRKRVWAIVSAHQQGLSLRQIARATTLSAARVHQLLTGNAAADIPVWLSRLREHDWPGAESGATDPPGASLAGTLTEEVTALRQCLGWLEQAERGETVVVNLRPDADPETEYVVFERWRILVLQR